MSGTQKREHNEKPPHCNGAASSDLNDLLAELAAHSAALELPGASPAGQLGRMAAAGVMQWGIPPEYGGCELSAAEQVAGMEALASACLVSTFVLSQRNAAVSRIVACDNAALKAELLPRLARHDLLPTVGISHLTTSRQHVGQPAVTASPTDGGYCLNGVMPWVTGGGFADVILAGGTLPDGRQILALVPTAAPEVQIQPPVPLLALNASQTAAVKLAGVNVASDRLVAGPVEAVMKQAGTGTGSATTSALALGAAAGTLHRFAAEVERRPELAEILHPLERERAQISADIQALLNQQPGHRDNESIRERANSLVLRASQAYLAASKGAGFVAGHPAERAVREAMFFLVWSCPRPVVDAALRRFACLGEGP